MRKIYRTSLMLVVIFCIQQQIFAQQTTTQVVTSADYARAEKAMLYNTAALADNIPPARSNWIEGDKLWYRVLKPAGSEFILADPARNTRKQAFNHQELAASLSAMTGKSYDANRLPFNSISYKANGSFDFTANAKNWNYNPASRSLTEISTATNSTPVGKPNSIVSPDGKKAVFIRDHNLWIYDLASQKETQLTTDGIKDYGYATDNAGWRKSDRPIVVWSPDSKKIATYQQDQRHVSDMYLVTTNVGKPTLQAWKYPLPQDKEVIKIRRVIIDVENAKQIPLKIPAGVRRGTLCDDISCGGKDFNDVQWNSNSRELAFVTTTRDHKQPTFWLADAITGDTRQVFDETVVTQYESGQGSTNWRYLPATKEIIWFSEKDDWGHLYLYDATTGQLKNQITKGNFAVTQLLRVDEQKKQLYFLASGREKGRNPYFAHLYKIGFDGKNLTLLTPEDGHHQVSFSPSGKFFTDRYSKQDMPPVMVLRNADGKQLTTLEKADISRLTAAGWKPPTPIVVKSRDGHFDLYGVMYTPSNLDPSKKYPIINYIYPGPQGGSVRNWGFDVANGDNQALAELGFVVVAIEGTCNPMRSKSFHDMCYGNMADNTLPDQIAGMKELAAKYPYIDINRVGIWGHSGGGYATAAAMFHYPEFFKVGISESGNHDNRNYEDDWGERYIGLLTEKDGKSNYEDQANQNFAKNLKGKLMIAHGMLDDNVPPYNSLLVVEALIKANKDFDLIIFPNSRHGYGEHSLYMTRRRWDYFVEHLQGAKPPKEYELKSKTDGRNAGN